MSAVDALYIEHARRQVVHALPDGDFNAWLAEVLRAVATSIDDEGFAQTLYILGPKSPTDDDMDVAFVFREPEHSDAQWVQEIQRAGVVLGKSGVRVYAIFVSVPVDIEMPRKKRTLRSRPGVGVYGSTVDRRCNHGTLTANRGRKGQLCSPQLNDAIPYVPELQEAEQIPRSALCEHFWAGYRAAVGEAMQAAQVPKETLAAPKLYLPN